MESKLFTVIVLAVFVFCLKPIAVMLLWNWLCPVIFGLPAISFLQALGMALLIGILFKMEIKNEKE